MTRRPSPSTLAMIWIGTFVPAVGLKFYLVQFLPPGYLYWSFTASLVVLACGLIVWWRYYRREVPLLTLAGWQWALLTLLFVEALESLFFFRQVGLPGDWKYWSIAVFRYFLVTGLREELWFRGIWFAMFRNRFVPSVLLGTLVFGLVHFPFGPGRVVSALCIGLVFAVARYRGASLLSLVLAHGMIDWLNGFVFPPSRPLFNPEWAPMVLAIACVAMAGGMLLCCRKRNPERS